MSKLYDLDIVNEDNEFELLLSEELGLECEEESDDWGEDNQLEQVRWGEVDFKQGNTVYRIPTSSQLEATLGIVGLKVFSGDLRSHCDKVRKEVYFASATSKVLYVELKTDVVNEKGGANVLLSLYREGVPSPIYQWQEEELYHPLHVFKLEDAALLIPGRYFLLLTNVDNSHGKPVLWDYMGTSLCYRFSILPRGEQLQCLSLQQLIITRGKEGQSICGTSGELHLKLSYVLPDTELYAVRLFGYNSDGVFMGEASEYKREVFDGSSHACMYFTLNSPYIWVEDDYTFVLAYNDKPEASLTCHLSEVAKVQTSWQYVTPDSFPSLLLKYLEPKLAWKASLCHLPGMREVRRQLYPLLCKMCYDAERMRRGILFSHSQYHYCISGEDEQVKKRLCSALPSILSFPYDSYKIDEVDATTLLKKEDAILNQTDVMQDLLKTRSGKIICLQRISVLFSGNGRAILDQLDEALKDTRVEWSLLLDATVSEYNQLFEYYPEWERYFPKQHRLELNIYSLCDVLILIQNHLKKHFYYLSPEAEQRLYHLWREAWLQQKWQGWDRRTTLDFIGKEIFSKVAQRMMQRVLAGEGVSSMDTDELQRVEVEDLEAVSFSNVTNSFEKNMRPLRELVGLQQMRRDCGLPISDESACHLIFTGNPGTGKTTVAKLMGRIFHSLGMLSKGDVVVTDRSQIVGRYLGETEYNMLNILQKARGNVLFIDEVYTLFTDSEDSKDYGRRAIEVLLPVLAQKDADIIVILAGYEREMSLMMQANVGLQGRFPYQFHFPDYQAEELLTIGKNVLQQGMYDLTPEAEECLLQGICRQLALKDPLFGNARWMKQVITSAILPVMAKRLVAFRGELTSEQLCRVEKSDVEEAFRRMNQGLSYPSSKRIGFR